MVFKRILPANRQLFIQHPANRLQMFVEGNVHFNCFLLTFLAAISFQKWQTEGRQKPVCVLLATPPKEHRRGTKKAQLSSPRNF
jgi:hypothetical protein